MLNVSQSKYVNKHTITIMQDLLNVVISSDKRKKILLLLLHGPKSMEEIRNTLKYTATGMLPQVRILEDRDLVRQEDKKYALTETGKLITTLLEPLVQTVGVIKQQEEYWREHDVGAIPNHLFMRISELGSTRIMKHGIEEIYEPHKEFLETISKSKKVMCISPMVHPAYPEFLTQLGEKGTEVSMVLTKIAFDKVKKEYSDLLSRALSSKNISFYISEDVKLTCIVTDSFFTISLFFKNGVFDSRNDFVSFDKSALLWGEELFNYYKKRSKKINNP